MLIKQIDFPEPTQNNNEQNGKIFIKKMSVPAAQIKKDFLIYKALKRATLINPVLSTVKYVYNMAQDTHNFSFNQEQDFSMLISILKKSPKQRKEQDIQYLKNAFKQTDFFDFYKEVFLENDKVYNEVMQNLSLEIFKSAEVITNMGKMGRKIFILIKGSAFILYPDNAATINYQSQQRVYQQKKMENLTIINSNNQNIQGQQQQSPFRKCEQGENQFEESIEERVLQMFQGFKIVRTLVVKNYFGDISVRYKEKRTSTIVSREHTYCAVLSFENYHKLLSSQNLKIYDIIKFFQRTMIFSIFEDGQLEVLVRQSQLVTYYAGNIIYKQGDIPEYIYIIVNGEVQLNQYGSNHMFSNIAHPSQYLKKKCQLTSQKNSVGQLQYFHQNRNNISDSKKSSVGNFNNTLQNSNLGYQTQRTNSSENKYFSNMDSQDNTVNDDFSQIEDNYQLTSQIMKQKKSQEKLRLTFSNAQRNKRMIAIIGLGECFGDEEVLQSSDQRSYNAQCFSQSCKVYRIPSQLFLDFFSVIQEQKNNRFSNLIEQRQNWRHNLINKTKMLKTYMEENSKAQLFMQNSDRINKKNVLNQIAQGVPTEPQDNYFSEEINVYHNQSQMHQQSTQSNIGQQEITNQQYQFFKLDPKPSLDSLQKNKEANITQNSESEFLKKCIEMNKQDFFVDSNQPTNRQQNQPLKNRYSSCFNNTSQSDYNNAALYGRVMIETHERIFKRRREKLIMKSKEKNIKSNKHSELNNHFILNNKEKQQTGELNKLFLYKSLKIDNLLPASKEVKDTTKIQNSLSRNVENKHQLMLYSSTLKRRNKKLPQLLQNQELPSISEIENSIPNAAFLDFHEKCIFGKILEKVKEPLDCANFILSKNHKNRDI